MLQLQASCVCHCMQHMMPCDTVINRTRMQANNMSEGMPKCVCLIKCRYLIASLI